MKSNPILLIAPFTQLYSLAEELIGQCDDIELELAYLDQAVQVAQRGVANGTEVIISRGGTFLNLEQCGVPVSLVEIPIDPFDVLNAVYHAKIYGRNIGIIGFANVIRGAERLGSILDLHVRTYLVTSEEEAVKCLDDAINFGIDVVLGGSLAEKLAKERGIPTVTLETSKEGIQRSVNEARRIVAVKRQEREKAEQYKTILHFINEGIIAVNKNYEVTIFNRAAESIIGLKCEAVMGKKINDVMGNADFSTLIRHNRPQLGQLLTFRSTPALTNSVPINVNGEMVGAVATLQNVTKIQEYEHTIRTTLIKKGHVAKFTFADILGNSKVLNEIKKIAWQYSQVESTILITGDSGTGKEMFAQSIHSASLRKRGPFVAINCAAIPANLLESELFGYSGGAFTGAKKEGMLGLFAIAHGGTIFLDEIGEIPTELQARLLRVLQEREIRPIGSDSIIPVDVRVIAATNKSLIEEVKSGKFRKDLYYRLNILALRIPSLCERRGDIALLCQYFINQHNIKLKKNLEISKEAFDIIEGYSWPGNVRELQNVLERLAVTSDGVIKPRQIMQVLDEYDKASPDEKPLKRVQKTLILATLAKCSGNRTLAAKQLGISRVQLWRCLKEDVHTNCND
ncbi:MAG: sigma 54-interacting transcriptional regulator [Negativicutes bacterium]